MGEWGRTRQGGRAASASAVVSTGQTALSLSLSRRARARAPCATLPGRAHARGVSLGRFGRVRACRRAAPPSRRTGTPAAAPQICGAGARRCPPRARQAPQTRPVPPSVPPRVRRPGPARQTTHPAARPPAQPRARRLRAPSAARRRRRRAPPAAHMPAAALRCACRLPPGAPAAVFLAATRVLATARHRARASMGRSRPQLWPSPSTDGYKCRGTIRPLSEGLGVSAASLRVGAVAAPAPLPLVLPPRFPTTGAGPRPGHSTVDTPSVRPDQPQPEHRGQRCICCPPVRWRDFAAAHAADRGARPVRTQAPPRRRREANSMAPAASRTTS